MSRKNNSSSPVRIVPASRFRDEGYDEVDDCLVVEEPLEIRINGRRFTATMRTPGDDALLARGLLFSEGIIRDNASIIEIETKSLCRERTGELVNLVNVIIEDDEEIPPQLWDRALISNASCGLCGKASIEALRAQVEPLPSHAPVAAEQLWELLHLLKEKQQLFEKTGGLHAAGIFRLGEGGAETLAVFEDIGRHNATDKAIGYGLTKNFLPDENSTLVLLVSGRASFEIVQKALVARIPIVASVSAASSLAVDLAQANNLTLIGFVRENKLTVYSGHSRIQLKH